MVLTVRFEKGDRVKHPKRPEWGSGIVRDIAPITHEGEAAQRLTIDFATKGRVVINAAIAPLEKVGKAYTPPKPNDGHRGSAAQLWAGHPEGSKAVHNGERNGAPPRDGDPGAPSSSGDSGWLDQLETAGGKKHELWELPDDLTDPFATPEQRLKATLDSYRYSTEPRALIEWAIVQTGLDDPLTKYTRPELEQAFPRFARDRDAHLRSQIREFKRKNDLATIKACQKGGLMPAAQSALDRALRG